MEIKSRKQSVNMDVGAIVIIIPEQDIKPILSVLNTMRKKSKPDRYEEYILNKLTDALENPKMPIPKDIKVATFEEKKSIKEIEPSVEINKTEIVTQVKQRFDPRNEKDMLTFIKESIEFAQKNIGIKTVPKDASVESFYDFLVESKIINIDGTPRGK